MKTLTLLRHAKSSWKDPGLIDHDRPLNKRGNRDILVMGERIVEAGIRPSLILSSTAVRAWTTAKGIAKAISYPLEFLQREQRLYHAGVRRMIGVLAEQDESFNNIMLVGHNPGLTDFANFLIADVTDNIPTCGFVSVTFEADAWNLDAAKEFKLAAYDFPKRKA